ncbi:disintegrin and metalloproteinase domain-containing protein 2-like [Neopsephotus bourkii]|uniref:disintegrin and metalloproteinase domain-containing protein 2-like n=1 Tax=Neopsephotus bourkii TaxID=309878 RepID=UPI002AA54F91|nr:disintegrin and metalloproteinase domain-containing protein 2-like [Neopsephotus bourkii]
MAMGPRRALLLLLLLVGPLRESETAPPRLMLAPGWVQHHPGLSSPPPPGSQVTVPLRLPRNATEAKDAVSYVLSIEGRPYTIRLHPHVFLSEDFKIFVSNEVGAALAGSVRFKGSCYYQGYIDGFPSSAVTLSTCSGLRGLLQFDNVSYGIEPLGYSPAFEHLVYRVRDGQAAGSLLTSSRPEAGHDGLTAMEAASRAQGRDEVSSECRLLPCHTKGGVGISSIRGSFVFQPLSAAARSPKYLQVYVILDKALYDHMGSDTKAATQMVIQVFNLVNSVFHALNVTIVLASLELWTQGNKVSTVGEAEDLLQRFLLWAKTHLALQPYDTAYLLVYRDQAAFVGTTAPGKACQRDAAGIVAVYQEATTLESFSALLAQLLGRSLGIGYDESPQCHCPGHVCIMSPEALHFSGVKAFSTCSIRDFEAFLKHGGGACLFSRPPLTGPSSQRAATCGNGIVEPGEQCDCGPAKACLKDKCCTAGCQFKPGVQCSSGPCCDGCQFKRKHWQCRPAADEQCDLAEFCTGASASCPPDLYVQDGHGCGLGTGYCYKGRCQSPDLQCQRIYGKGSRNAPVACYEELNSQQDRFGHCGLQPSRGFKSCSWRDLRCGKLICTYPYRKPFPTDVAAVAYVHVRGRLCVSLNYLHAGARLDPTLVPPGAKCGSGKVCINDTCQPRSVLGYGCDSKVKCHGHGVCNNKGQCHCHPGWKPPDCLQRGSRLGGSTDSGLPLPDGGLSLARAMEDVATAWPVLGSCLLLLLLAGAICLLIRWWALGLCGARPPSTNSSAVTAESSEVSEWSSVTGLDTDPDTDADTEPEPSAGSSRGR